MLAIHSSDNSFSGEWIRYCMENNIPYREVNCFDNDIVKQVEKCDAVLWHYHHGKRADMAAARRVLRALEHSGKIVFPNWSTAWYFDDKAAQKYLFEVLEIPAVKTHIFYNLKTMSLWLKSASLPLVFKSSAGAGSSGVKLVNSKRQAIRLAKKSIIAGFSPLDKRTILRDLTNWSVLKNTPLMNSLKMAALLFLPKSIVGTPATENGVALFQEFIPGNDSDIRIIVINGRAFGIRRYVRKGDFRASGSGRVSYDLSNISKEIIHFAFEVADKLASDCCAIDFVFKDGRPLVVEVSYGFSIGPYKKCPGYWNRDLEFIESYFDPYAWMIEGVLNKIKTQGISVER